MDYWLEGASRFGVKDNLLSLVRQELPEVQERLMPTKSPATPTRLPKLVRSRPNPVDGAMSSPLPSEAQAMDLTGDGETESTPIHYKSYRKKWRKMRINFEHAMEDANDMFIRENKAWEIAKRLQEQNDQILDIIHDLELDGFPEKHARDTWQTSVPEAFGFSRLTADTSHTIYPPGEAEKMLNGDLPSDLRDYEIPNSEHTLPPGFLTFEHETAYLDALDASLAEPAELPTLGSNVEAVEKPNVPPNHAKHVLHEQDFAQSHPTSVYNWLRRNKPEMFVDKTKAADKDSERSGQSPAPAGKAKKKTKADLAAEKKEREKEKEKADVPFEELDEDIGYDAALDQPAKGKRKRDDDTYRPKGGHSSRAAKRRKGKTKEEDAEEGQQVKMEDEDENGSDVGEV